MELDIEGFYDRVDHDLLMRLIAKRICDQRVLKLLRQWLKRACWTVESSFSATRAYPRVV